MTELPMATTEEIKRVMTALGARGGSVRSAAKREAARANAQKPRGKRRKAAELTA